jgi:large repetitive protein
LEGLEARTLLSFTPIAQPGDTLPSGTVYTAGTTNLAGDIPADGDTLTTLSDGIETITFSDTMTAGTVPLAFSTWNSPPATESSTPRILTDIGATSLTLGLSKPADVFGFEIEPDNLVSTTASASFFEGSTLVGTVNGSFSGTASALLFAGSTDQAFTSVVITEPSAGGGFAIAQPRYALATATLGITNAASSSPVLPGNNVTYTIGLTNSGPNDAIGTTVTDPLPADTNFQGDTAPAGWTVSAPAVGSGGTVTFTDTNPFTNGSTATFTITAQVNLGVPAGTTVTNTAAAASLGSNSPTASASFTVGGPLTGTSGNEITGVEGSSTGTVLLGTFTDANQSSTAADYTTPPGSVVVNWGDVSAPQTLTASDLTPIGTPNGVVWEIDAAHTYTEEGTYQYTVTVTSVDGAATIVAGSAIIADAALTAGAPTLLTAHTGVALPSSTVVGTFTDANTFATTADFTGTIGWGDGSPPSTAVFVATATPGLFDVEGGHTYAKAGVYTTLITVHDDGGSQVVITGSSTVTDLPVTGATNSFTSTEGQSTGTFALATFTDPNTLATVANVNATLAIGGWGDGTPTTAGVTLVVQEIGVTPLTSATNPGAPIFEVLGSHTYQEETPAGLPDTLSVIITTLGGATTTLTSPPGGGVTVLDAPLTSSNGTAITGIEGTATPATTLLGTFVDANPLPPEGSSAIADFTSGGGSVVVNWGDGTAPQTLTAANLTVTGSNNGAVYSITASHDYVEEGTYAYTVVVTDDGGATTKISGSAFIADAPLTDTGLTQPTVTQDAPNIFPLPVFAPPLFSGPVAEFTDTNPSPLAGSSSTADFTATIDWGDGTALSPGTIVSAPTIPGGVPNYDVDGSHTYAKSGSYTITAFVVDTGGSRLTVTNTNVTVVANTLSTTLILNPSSDSGLSTGTPDVTNVNQPDFFGTVTATPPPGSPYTPSSEGYAEVTLTATNLTTQVATTIGSVQADSSGDWNIKSTVALPDGTYSISTTVTDQFGQGTATAVGIPSLLIDTVGPVIDGMFFNRLNGQVDFIIKDPVPASGAPSGVWVNTLLDSSNYLLTKVHANKAFPGKWYVSDVTATPDPTIPYAYDVAVTFNGGASIRGGFYLFTIRDSSNGNSSVQDRAENHLDGVFYGSFPSGNGINGSDFVAELQAYHFKVFAPQTIIGTSSAANGGNGGKRVAPVHSGIHVPVIPRGGAPIFSTPTSPRNGGDPPAKKVKASLVGEAKHKEVKHSIEVRTATSTPVGHAKTDVTLHDLAIMALGDTTTKTGRKK